MPNHSNRQYTTHYRCQYCAQLARRAARTGRWVAGLIVGNSRKDAVLFWFGPRWLAVPRTARCAILVWTKAGLAVCGTRTWPQRRGTASPTFSTVSTTPSTTSPGKGMYTIACARGRLVSRARAWQDQKTKHHGMSRSVQHENHLHVHTTRPTSETKR